MLGERPVADPRMAFAPLAAFVPAADGQQLAAEAQTGAQAGSAGTAAGSDGRTAGQDDGEEPEH